MNTVEVNEDEFLALIEENKKLHAKVDRLEMAIYGTLRVFDKLIAEGDME